MSQLTLIQGGGDIVETIERLLERARAGELDGVVLCEIHRPTDAGSCSYWSWAHRDDAAVPWARLLGVVASAQHELLADGL